MVGLEKEEKRVGHWLPHSPGETRMPTQFNFTPIFPEVVVLIHSAVAEVAVWLYQRKNCLLV